MFLNESQKLNPRRIQACTTEQNFPAVQLGCESFLIISIFIQTHLH